MHFVKGKESEFVPKLVISKWERKQGTNKMDIEGYKRFTKKRNLEEEFFV